MNSFLKAGAVAALGCLIGLMCGCASSSLVNKWHDPSFHAAPLGKMLVIAVRKDATMRRIWEDAFTGELVKHGVAALSSYSLFPDAPPDTNQIVATVQSNGFDGVLAVLRLPTETNTHYVQGYTTIEQNVDYVTYWQRYGTYYHEIDHPGYVDSQSVAIRTIDVSTTGNGGKMIWSATSRTPDPSSVTDLQRGVASLVTADLARQNIISSRK
jgi:hypothetical protein